MNLALDHIVRFPAGTFPQLPREYYADWIEVAAEEAMHFELLRTRLQSLNHDYGDFPAHAGLWEMAEKTAHDPLTRMALIPRLLEARGLDATPPIQQRLEEAGDEASALALDIILRDEIGHVGLGDRWFRHLCATAGLEPEAHYRQLLLHYRAPWPQAPMNDAARLQAGFSAAELAALAKKM
ncbi:ferritin-like domain-containing protein [Dechloromonas sp. ZY10]|uniref:ferritin-like domain-containing protein n=1 Tax=Dechloromonas aquae TaxID=2664436 RepID=UPI0035284FB8